MPDSMPDQPASRNNLHRHEVLARADELYEQRRDIENVRLIVDLLAPLTTYESSWRLAKAFFFLGQEVHSKSDALSFYSKGITSAKCAVRIDPKRVEGHFWLGVNLALHAQARRSPRSLLQLFAAKRELKQAVAIDPVYHAAGPLRVLARLFHKTSGWLGGSGETAQQYYERAIQIAPANTVSRIYLAELLIDMKKNDQAIAELEHVITLAEDPSWTFEAARDKQLAQSMLKSLSAAEERSREIAEEVLK